MRGFVRFLTVLVIAAAIIAGGAWLWAGRMTGPTIEIRQPNRFIGQATPLELMVRAPEGRFTSLEVTLEQNGRSFPIFTLAQPSQATTRQESADRLYVMRQVGKQTIPELQTGAARLVVRATRPVLYGIRNAESTATRELQVRLESPRVAVLSRFHYINHGGAEFVIYRATPADVASGVRVGDQTYPGYPGSGVGIKDDGSTRVAFFALLHDQDLNTPIEVFARDDAGNQSTAALDWMAFPKPFARSRIEINDRFLQRVVPPIIANTPDMPLSSEPDKLLDSFLQINRELRRRNNQTILDLAAKSSPQMMWTDAFQPLANAAVEAKFADNRTYVYNRMDVDQQVHLGFDLAVTAQVPIRAAQRGTIVHASYLGIYGNCVVIDHGLGVQSLYGHLSSLGVKVGNTVEKGQEIGRSGMTGLAAGDHLHFTMLVTGRPVNPVEWWDQKWMEDRVFRKIMEAGGVR